MYKFNVEKTTKEIIAWIQDWFSLNGNGCNAVVGISGGKDGFLWHNTFKFKGIQ